MWRPSRQIGPARRRTGSPARPPAFERRAMKRSYTRSAIDPQCIATPHRADLGVGYALRAGPAGHDGAMSGTAHMRASPTAIHFAARTGCIRSNICAAWTARCRMPTARPPAPAPRDTGNKQDKDSKDSAKSRPDPRAKDRAEGQSQFDYLGGLGIASNSWMRISGAGTTSRYRGRRCARLRSLRQVARAAVAAAAVAERLVLHHRSRCPAAASGRRRPSPATCWSHRASACGCGPTSRAKFRRSGAVTRPPNSSRPALRPAMTRPLKILAETGWSVTPLIFEIGSTREFQFALETG